MPEHPHPDHHIIRELLIHGAAFLVAAAIGAVVLWRFYWLFEQNTEDPAVARQAFLASVFLVGGIGPAITMLFLWVRGLLQRWRD
jgi:hypothetical protein